MTVSRIPSKLYRANPAARRSYAWRFVGQDVRVVFERIRGGRQEHVFGRVLTVAVTVGPDFLILERLEHGSRNFADAVSLATIVSLEPVTPRRQDQPA